MSEEKIKLLKFILQIVVSIATALITALSTTACVRAATASDMPSPHEVYSAWFDSIA